MKLLSQEEFTERSIKFLEEELKGFHNIKMIDSYTIALESGNYKAQFYTTNMWKRYKQEGDFTSVMNYIKRTIEAQINSHFSEKPTIDKLLDVIYPTIRNEKFASAIPNSNAEPPSFVKEDFYVDLSVFFMASMEEYYFPIGTELLTEEIDEKVVKQKAYENLKRQGWIEKVQEVKLESGTVQIYHNEDKPFNYQFFMADWVREHIGTQFIFSIPQKDMVFVYIPQGELDLSMSNEDLQIFIGNAMERFKNDSHSISSTLMHFEGNEYNPMKVIGIEKENPNNN